MAAESHAQLLEAARSARGRAYAPYSSFRVGAAVLADDQIFAGCNVENASYGLTICAERVAVFAAIAAGHRQIEAVAVATEAPAPTAPCGACRQVLHEFGPDMTVLIAAGDEVVATTLRALLPMAFGPEDLVDTNR
jgi:cytidine deaminase